MQKRLILMLLLFTVACFSLYAGTTGKLAGKITDADGEPVPFANVVIMEGEVQVAGVQGKFNGTYMIINIPPGIYSVIVSAISYHPHTLTGVKINLDETTVQNISLIGSAIELEEYLVTEAKHVKVSKTKTGSGMTLDMSALEDSAVDDIDDAISQTAGVESVNGEIHVRGGRSNEVVYTIDGLSVSDPVDGGSSLSVDMDAVKVMDVQTGGFTAEFGNAQSGIINIVTKDGDHFYSGKVEVTTDHLGTAWDNSNSDQVKFALGGPVLGPLANNLKEKFTFFVNGNAKWHDSRYKDLYSSNPNDIPDLIQNYSYEDPYSDREDIIGFDVGSDRNYNLLDANLKTKYRFNEKANATFAMRGNSSIYTPYSHSWRYALDHFAEVDNQKRQYISTFDQTFGAVANLKVKASYYQNNVKRGPIGISRDDYFVKIVGDDAENAFDLYALDDTNRNYTGIDVLTDDGLVGEGAELNWSYLADGNERDVPGYVSPGSIYATNIDDQTKTITLRMDYEYQPNFVHGFKTGLEVIKYNIKKDRLFNPWIVNENRYDAYLAGVDPVQTVFEGDPLIDTRPGETYGDTLIAAVAEDIDFYSQDDLFAATMAAAGDTDGYIADPWQGAFYIQDKMEWEGMVINAGLRFDMWYLGDKYKRIKSGGNEEWYHFEDDEKIQLMISPRFGISHPISDKSVVHFGYNYQNQLPPMAYVFTAASPNDAIGSTSAITIGEPKLDPQITVTYEVGLRKQLSENYNMDIQAYFKNTYNYVTTQKVYLQDDGTLMSYQDAQLDDDANISVPLYRYISEDYGSVRGIDINLQRGLANFIQGSMSYSLSWSEGNNSGVRIQNEATSLREFPLDWDSRHSFSSSLTFRVADDEEWYIPFAGWKFPMDDFSLNFTYSLKAGNPYTPEALGGALLDTNSELMSFYENARLKFTKTFKLNKKGKQYFKAYAGVDNLFNRRNINSVYARTGSAYLNGVDISEPNSDYVATSTEQIYNSWTANPANWSVGRTLSVGMSFHF